MKSKRARKAFGVGVLASLLLTAGGCPPDEYDWTWAVPSIIAAFGIGSAVGQSQTTVIERFCFENGQPVDCSQIPFVP